MAEINPSRKRVSYSLDSLKEVQAALDEIERLALEEGGVDGRIARTVCAELNNVRRELSLPQGVSRHPKFSNQ